MRERERVTERMSDDDLSKLKSLDRPGKKKKKQRGDFGSNKIWLFCIKAIFVMVMEDLYVKIKRTSLNQRKTSVSSNIFTFFNFFTNFSIFYP